MNCVDEGNKNMNDTIKFKIEKTNGRGLNINPITNGMEAGKVNEMVAVALKNATGSCNREYATILFGQTLIPLINKEFNRDADTIVNAVQAALAELEPKDSIEGHLISRMIVLHTNYMDLLQKPANFDLAIEIMTAYNETLDALINYRRTHEG